MRIPRKIKKHNKKLYNSFTKHNDEIIESLKLLNLKQKLTDLMIDYGFVENGKIMIGIPHNELFDCKGIDLVSESRINTNYLAVVKSLLSEGKPVAIISAETNYQDINKTIKQLEEAEEARKNEPKNLLPMLDYLGIFQTKKKMMLTKNIKCCVCGKIDCQHLFPKRTYGNPLSEYDRQVIWDNQLSIGKANFKNYAKDFIKSIKKENGEK